MSRQSVALALAYTAAAVTVLLDLLIWRPF